MLAYICWLFVQDESLAGWRINRVIDGQERADYTLPRDMVLKSGQKIKVSVSSPQRTGKKPVSISLQMQG